MTVVSAAREPRVLGRGQPDGWSHQVLLQISGTPQQGQGGERPQAADGPACEGGQDGPGYLSILCLHPKVLEAGGWGGGHWPGDTCA